MAVAYSASEKAWVARRLAIVAIACTLLSSYLSPAIPAGTARVLFSFSGFMAIGVCLFRALEVRGWDYKWIVAAHLVWGLPTLLGVINQLVLLACAISPEVSQLIMGSPDLPSQLANDPLLPQKVQKLKLAYILKHLTVLTIVRALACVYIGWSCMYIGRNRRDVSEVGDSEPVSAEPKEDASSTATGTSSGISSGTSSSKVSA